MKVNLYRQITITSPDGKVKRGRRRKCDSYVLAFADLLYVRMSQGSQSIKDTGNASRSASSTNAFSMSGASTTIGPQVGTGTNAVTLADYALQTKIAHGTGGGQLQYGITTVNAPTTSGTTRRFTVTRAFTNSSGGSITINETAIYTVSYSDGSANRYFCIIRDIESPGVEVSNGATATLTYTLQVTV